MNWNGYGWPAPPPPSDHHTPLLMQLNQAIQDLHRSSGRIEGTLEQFGQRMEEGDTNFREIRQDLHHIKGEVATLKAEKKTEPKPSRLSAFKELAEVVLPAVKEAWPFLAVAGAGAAKALGYCFDLSGFFGHP